ncbi:hypothetical protein HID58_007051 [Brassica napus]|uniref:Uncharacterized protein n=1 Tax=Brassica napus TaxID=3708 RepID=A0ABQ8ED59_BRANA|nr:hypothetical protein HID58_007051 [Brassica napus]
MISSTYLQFYRRRRQVPEAIRAVRHRDLHGNSHQGRFLLEAVQALHGFENCARRRRHHLHRSCRETDPPVPMLKYTNLDVIRVLVDLKNHTILIYNKASEYDCNIEQAVGGVLNKSSELISPYNNLLSCRWLLKVQVHERMWRTIQLIQQLAEELSINRLKPERKRSSSFFFFMCLCSMMI